MAGGVILIVDGISICASGLPVEGITQASGSLVVLVVMILTFFGATKAKNRLMEGIQSHPEVTNVE